MKMVICFYNVAIDTVVMEMLEKNGIAFFTKISNVSGKGSHSLPKFNTLVWPGYNNGLLMIIEDKQKETLLAAVRELKKVYKKEGLKAVVLNVEETT